MNEQASTDFRGLGWDEAQRIVHSAVREVTKGSLTLPPPHSFEDLTQEGMTALWEASRAFDPDREVPFPQYARRAVAYALLRYLRAADPLPERSRRDLRKVQRAEERLVAAGECSPTAQQVAQQSGLTVQRVLRVRREQYEASEPRGNQPFHLEYPGLSGDTPEDRYLLWESRARIRKAILRLTTRQRAVFQMRLIERKSVVEAATAMGVSKGRVSQLSREIEEILRSALEGE